MDRRKTVSLFMCIFLVAGVLSLVAYKIYKPDKNNLAFETNIKVGDMSGDNMKKRKAELQALLDKSMIAFSINTNPEFDNGKALGNLMFENPKNNNKFLVLELYLAETNEKIYKSKALKPGTYMEGATLLKNLPKGTHRALAYFKGYEMKLEKYIGQVGAEILIHINN